METKRLAAGLLMLGACAFASAARAQPVHAADGPTALGVTLRQINSVGSFLMVTAHPDDENNALLARLAKGEGHRTVLLTATRGDGGQNEIGAELFDALAVLRTEELLAAHRIDGAEQYFTRAVDFGYSFSLEETFARWGRDEILGDIVRMIRTIRPDVMSALSPSGGGGGQHHQASAVLAHEAYHAAADPDRFPEQIGEGLRPWQVKKFYFRDGFPFGFGDGPPGFEAPAPAPDVTTVDLGAYDPLLGATYAELGSRARSMHKCQGMSPLVALPVNAVGAHYRLAETAIPGPRDADESWLFDGVETGIVSLAAFAGTTPPGPLAAGLAELAGHASDALRGFERDGQTGAREAVIAGLRAVRALRARLGTWPIPAAGRWEIDARLALKERQLERAVVLAHALRLEALADDGVVVPGQAVGLSAIAANRGAGATTVRGVRFVGLEGGQVCPDGSLAAGAVYRCRGAMTVPADSPATDIHWTHDPVADRYVVEADVPFGAPFRPTPFRAIFDLEFDGLPVAVEQPVQYRYANDLFAGEKRATLNVVPSFVVSMTPEIAIVPVGRAAATEVRVTVTSAGPEPSSGVVSLELPTGWRSTPASVPVAFSREDESRTVRFQVATGDGQRGEFRVGAVVVSEGRRFGRGSQVVEYPHIERRQVGRPADGRMKLVDVAIAPELTVGYVDGVGDAVPQAIEQLGASLEFIETDDLAWGDLSRFDVIVTGVRAYERRQDLRAYNDRLLQYVDDGGTVIVQYNKFEFNEAQYAPYPARVSRNRVTDETAPVRPLTNDHPVFARPNRIDAATWDDWVQERGLYFLGERDERFVDLVELEDTFEYNRGVKRGALVEAAAGRGRWIYIGLGLWRQLPAGTTGAYALLANLLSLGRD